MMFISAKTSRHDVMKVSNKPNESTISFKTQHSLILYQTSVTKSLNKKCPTRGNNSFCKFFKIA